MSQAWRSPSGRYWDWAAIVTECRQMPKVWYVRLNGVPARLRRTVTNRQAPELHLDDGVIEAMLLHLHTDDLGTRRGDLVLRFVPTPREDGQHDQR